MPPADLRPQSLQVIRLGLSAGVLMFGAVILFLHQQPTWHAGTLPTAVQYVLVAYGITVVSVATVLKGRLAREADPERRTSLLVVGWAIGESAALFGAVIFYITGQAQWYLFGLLAMACALVLLRPETAV